MEKRLLFFKLFKDNCINNYSQQIRLRRARSASDEVPCCTEPVIGIFMNYGV